MREKFTCPRCNKFVEVDVENGNAVCPVCENDVFVPRISFATVLKEDGVDSETVLNQKVVNPETEKLSIYAKIKQALELAKVAGVGCQFNQFEAVELLGYIKSMEEYTADLQSELAALKEAQRWIPVSERKPETKKDTLFLTFANGRVDTRTWFWDARQFSCNEVTHWMPLPQPPEAE